MCYERGQTGEGLWKSEKKQWRARLGEERGKGRLDDASGFQVRSSKMGGTQMLLLKTAVTTGVVNKASSGVDLPGSESSSTSEKLCGFEEVP